MKLKSTFATTAIEKRNSVFYSDDLEDVASSSSPDSDENTVIDNQSVIDLTQVDHPEGGCLGELDMSPPACCYDENNDLLNRKVNRPVHLDLIDDNGCPIRPPRHLKKRTREKQRDQRLLSVPNIKFQKAELQSYRDLREKEDVIVSPQPPSSFSTNLMRRFSKF